MHGVLGLGKVQAGEVGHHVRLHVAPNPRLEPLHTGRRDKGQDVVPRFPVPVDGRGINKCQSLVEPGANPLGSVGGPGHGLLVGAVEHPPPVLQVEVIAYLLPPRHHDVCPLGRPNAPYLQGGQAWIGCGVVHKVHLVPILVGVWRFFTSSRDF